MVYDAVTAVVANSALLVTVEGIVEVEVHIEEVEVEISFDNP